MTKKFELVEKFIKTSDFSEIKKVLDFADQDTLVVFDVDDVLFSAVDQILNPKHNQFMVEKLLSLVEGDTLKAYDLYSYVFMQRKIKPVDERLISLIKKIQSRNIRTVALTNCYTEKFGQITSMKDWRLNELRKFDYHFDRSWEGASEKKFEHLITGEIGIFPIFKSGVLFTNNVSKGKVLEAFLDYVSFKFHRIIFIDDRLDYLESVRDVAKEVAVSYLGIQYTGADARNNQELCQKRATYQLEILVKEKKWLSDQEANKKLKFDQKPF